MCIRSSLVPKIALALSIRWTVNETQGVKIALQQDSYICMCNVTKFTTLKRLFSLSFWRNYVVTDPINSIIFYKLSRPKFRWKIIKVNIIQYKIKYSRIKCYIIWMVSIQKNANKDDRRRRGLINYFTEISCTRFKLWKLPQTITFCRSRPCSISHLCNWWN
jgi:hypothetical protein